LRAFLDGSVDSAVQVIRYQAPIGFGAQPKEVFNVA
jgi:hypothetical protein